MTRLIASTALAIVLASPAYATNPPPTPAPTQTQGQGQAQGQGQFQGQGQQQRATGGNATGGNATGGQGGAGGRGGNQTQGQTVNVDNSGNGSNNGGNGGGNNGWNGSNFPASSAYAPSFALSSICQEAISGGVSVFWAGASGGKVYTLDFCKMTMQADYYRKQGREDMAKAAECKFSEARALYKETGTPCREDEPKATTVATSAPQPQRVLNAGGLQCVDAAGRPVALGQPGAARCN